MTEGKYDLIVIGTGPGGYETAIRATQLGLATAVIERDKLGGVCLNVGCIPTKALLKSAEVMATSKRLKDFGLVLEGSVSADFNRVIQRSRIVAEKRSKGVAYLMKKNGIDVVPGHARFVAPGRLDVQPSVDLDGKQIGEARTVEAEHVIIATGARARQIPPLPVDGKKIVTYKEAMLQRERPDRLVVVGAGAIGVEFAYFYHHMGTEVTIVEMLDRIVPVEDEEISAELERAYVKMGIRVLTGAQVHAVKEEGPELSIQLRTKGGTEVLASDQVLSAVGVVGNIENLGLETIGVETKPGAIVVDELYRTSVERVYAIGDVAGPPWLAHKASHEGILCVEKIAGEDVHPMDYDNIPGCTYCQPQIASVGRTEKAARDAGHDVLVGKFPFTASGKAGAIGHPEGFVKVIYDKKYGELIGCHILGEGATEMIAEVVAARALEATGESIMDVVHPHPTLSEAILEATRIAYGRSINF